MSGESYYDRGSVEPEHMEDMEESSIGGMLKRRIYKVDVKVEMAKLKDKVKELNEGDFIPVSDEYGNELCVYADDFPELTKEARGSEVMFVIRCGMNKVNDGPYPVGGGKPRQKISLYIWDAALVHAMCGKKKDYK